MNPLVSIGMPVFNCETTVSSAVKSILNQTYHNWELILIDDGSKDSTLSIIKSFKDPRIKIIADGLNQNLPKRLNQAIALSRGKYFARMDGDDIAYPKRIQAQVEYLENNPDIDLLGTNIIVIDKDSNPIGSFSSICSHAEICRRPRAGFLIVHPTWMGKIDWFRNHQYRSKAIRTEDTDLLLRTYQKSKFARLPDILLGYRVDSLSLKKIIPGRYYTSISLIEKAFADKNYFLLFGVIEQLAKALVDVFAITTGLNLKLLRHRAGTPVNQTELVRWQQIWTKCNS